MIKTLRNCGLFSAQHKDFENTRRFFDQVPKSISEILAGVAQFIDAVDHNHCRSFRGHFENKLSTFGKSEIFNLQSISFCIKTTLLVLCRYYVSYLAVGSETGELLQNGS